MLNSEWTFVGCLVMYFTIAALTFGFLIGHAKDPENPSDGEFVNAMLSGLLWPLAIIVNIGYWMALAGRRNPKPPHPYDTDEVPK